MKFSKSLLEDKDIGKNIFNSSIGKTKELLSDVFGLDFKTKDPMIKEIIIDEDFYLFKVTFYLNNRVISASLNYQPEGKDVLRETLTISESVERNIEIKIVESDYKKAINQIMDFLEEKYEINFISLDPDEIDNNIKIVEENREEKFLEVVFSNDSYESEFKARFIHNEEGLSSLSVIENKKHIIIFE